MHQKPLSYIALFLSLVPRAIWFLGAIFGIFIFGVFVGMSFTDMEGGYDLNPGKFGKDQAYYDIIKSYETLNNEYYEMMQDMEILTDVKSWEDDPESVFNAIDGYRQRRDRILFDQGIIYEKREKAELELLEYTN